ncbi:uncharacterized protein [Pleurodeles waltl]|uniref:uncharacterized protein isoform X2 n=1 Tax=Pleurodeles waltl TaxID=8319 RepID=UPI003709C111
MEGTSEPTELLSGFLSKRRQTMKFQWRGYFCILTDAALSYYKVTPETDEKGILWGRIVVKFIQSVRAVSKITQHYPLELVLESGKIVLLNRSDQLENETSYAIPQTGVMNFFSLLKNRILDSSMPEKQPGRTFKPNFLEVTISGVLLIRSCNNKQAAHNKEEQNKWLQAIWKAMVISGQEETSCRKTTEGFCCNEDLLTLKSDSMKVMNKPKVSELKSSRPEGSTEDTSISGLCLNDVTEDMDEFINRTFDGISFNRQSMMGRQSHLHDSRIQVEKEAS